MSLLPQSLRSTYCYASRLQPIASSSRLGYYAAFRSSTSIRSAHAIPRPDTASGFEGVPAPAYNGTIADVKGKQKEVEPPAKASAPRRKIQSKKAAISMTPAALDRLRALVASPTEPKLLRIGVKTRGCAGMAYHLDYVPPPGGRFDEVVEQDGVRVLIDSKALFSIIGSVMDWRDNRLSAGFVFDNPNVVDECGCGESLKLTSPVHWPCGSGPDTRSRYLDDEEFPAVRVTPTPDLDSP